jgi:putative ABC transport system permease protein
MTQLLHRLLGRLPVGWLQLTHSRGRLVAALAGVAFANVLVLVQVGLAGALNGTIVQGYAFFKADIMISAADGNTITDGSNVARANLWRALADPRIEDGAALYVGTVIWSRESGDTALQTFGIDPMKTGFVVPGLAAQLPGLAIANRAAIDRTTRRLEPQLVANLSEDAQLRISTSGRTLAVTSAFSGGVGFTADGYMLVSDQTFLSLFSKRAGGAPNHLLLHTTPGADPEVVAQHLQERLGPDLRIRTMERAIADDQRYQGTQRPTGIIFGFGVVIGILVGLVIVYQVLSTDVADHLREYATFKAVGYRQSYFVGVILEEALILAALGFLPGILIASGLYLALHTVTGLPLAMTWTIAFAVFIGTSLACGVSGILATRRLAAADPAELF